MAELVADIPSNALVVDIGCGNGSFLSLFQNRGWQLYGSDYSSTGIEIARANYPDIKFSLANAESMPEELASRAGQFDLVLNTEVIEHVYNPRGLLKTCHSLLKPNGTLVLTTPYHGYFKNLLLAVTGKLDRHFTVLWDHGHIKFWSHKDDARGADRNRLYQYQIQRRGTDSVVMEEHGSACAEAVANQGDRVRWRIYSSV